MPVPEPRKTISPIEATIFLTSFVAATYAFGVYLFSALVPDIRSELNVGQDIIGIASGAAQGGNMVFAVIAGVLVPKIGPIRAIYLFLLAAVLCQGAFFMVTDVRAMVAVLFILGGTGSSTWVAIVVASQTLIPVQHRAKALGLMSSGTSFGLFVTGLIVPPLVESWGWRYAWLVLCAVTLLLVLVSLWRFRRILALPGRAAGDNDPEGKVVRQRYLTHPAALFATLLLFGTALSLVPYQTYLTSLLREGAGWSVGGATRAWSAIGFGGMLGGILLGSAADSISIRWTLVLTYLILIVAMPAPIVVPGIPVVVYSALFMVGMSFFALFGLIAAYIARIFPPEIAAVISGRTFVAVGFGSMIGNFAAGQIIEATQAFTHVYIGATVIVAGLVVASLCMTADRQVASVSS